MRYKLYSLIASGLFFTFLFAQNRTATIAGTVKDSRGKKPLIEAVVTVSSPAINGNKFALTDSTGQYRINNLPAGVYSVSFEMEGFRKYTQDSVRLSDGMSLGVSFEMARERSGQDSMRTRSRKREVIVKQ